jgi:hypothetical protein
MRLQPPAAVLEAAAAVAMGDVGAPLALVDVSVWARVRAYPLPLAALPGALVDCAVRPLARSIAFLHVI